MNLKKHIKHLPDHEPEDWLWQKIESHLNTEDAEQAKLRSALTRLPQYEPTMAWASVENSLNQIQQEEQKLKTALQHLKQYDAPASLWEKVETNLKAVEKEDFALQNAIKSLPQHEPEIDIWAKIDNNLNFGEQEDLKLKEALQRLPQHEPRNVVWMKVMQDLPAARRPLVLRMFTDVRMSAAAALIGFVLTIGLYFYGTQPAKDSVEIAFTKEIVDDETLKSNAKFDAEDENAFAMVEEICQTQTFICEQPEVKTLKSELDELNYAKIQLKEAIGLYGTDTDLQKQLSSIELERTEVLKKIMTLI